MKKNRVVRMAVGLTVANGGTISTRIAVATRKKYAEQGRGCADRDRIFQSFGELPYGVWSQVPVLHEVPWRPASW